MRFERRKTKYFAMASVALLLVLWARPALAIDTGSFNQSEGTHTKEEGA